MRWWVRSVSAQMGEIGLQSGSKSVVGKDRKWWAYLESNQGPRAYQARALTV